MVRVADYIAHKLAEAGLRDLFMVTGGGAMHLNDAFGKEPGLRVICCHHEQACAMAAESYFRLTGRLAAVSVTTGPGSTNAITGVHGAWTDSMGLVVISGQVKRETQVRSTGLPLRQLGDQEVDIVPIVASITKYAVLVEDPASIRFHLEKAIHLARSGRPGPVWLDVPMNVQGAQVDPLALEGFTPEPDPGLSEEELTGLAREVLARLAKSRRPAILAGSGVRIGGAQAAFLTLAERLGVPVTTAFNAHDLLPHDHPLLCGRPGTIGDRAGNFTVQNADFLLILACRLNIRQISYNWADFARKATKVMVDIDPAELAKPTLSIDLPVCADIGRFLGKLLELAGDTPAEAHGQYLAWCRERVARYPVVLPEYRTSSGPINPYCFVEALFQHLEEGDLTVTANASACIVPFQAARLKRGQRLYSNSGSASMGYDLPAAVGAAVGAPGHRVICLAGDGSLQMNVQELATIAFHRFPIKIFVLNNGGYHSIRQTQNAYFPQSPIGFQPDNGVGFPRFEGLAQAYGLPFVRLASHADLEQGLTRALGLDGPVLCEVVLDPAQPFAPKLASRRMEDGRMVSAALEDMAPFLSREELRSNILE
ncbi:MAG: thiamine pyrophosphate-binding protein [Holophaga sp.]|nr:thiamine pyrophosphate-binding protein [Holophaga sp.]